MKAFLLKLAAIIVQHKLLAGIVAAAVVAGGVTTGVVVHNNNVNNNDVVVAENETKEIKEKETTKKTVSLETLKVALKDEATVFYTDSAITNDLFTVIGVYTDKSEKELTEFTITPVELVVGENILTFKINNVSTDFIINVSEKPVETTEYVDNGNPDYNYEEPNNETGELLNGGITQEEVDARMRATGWEIYYIDGNRIQVKDRGESGTDFQVIYPTAYGYCDNNRSLDWAMRILPNYGYTYVRTYDVIYNGKPQTSTEWTRNGFTYECNAWESLNGDGSCVNACRI